MIKLKKLLNEMIASGDYLETGAEAKEKFPDQIEGNDGIIFKKVSQSGDRVKYNQYYRGYDIDAGGHVFGSVDELERFMKNYILSNNLYNKYKHMPKKEDYKLEEKVDMEELEMMLKKLKKENPGKKVTYTFKKDSPKGYVFFIDTKLVKEIEDHEVFMAQKSLKQIQSAAQSLMAKLGDDEKDIPAWIQDHITNAENFIKQASEGFYVEDEEATSVT